MAGIIIPDDRTSKQPATGYCLNPTCAPSGQLRFDFPLKHNRLGCPKCGANKPPLVGLLVLVHYLIANPLGEIEGMWGRRFSLGCDEIRAYLATTSNLEAATASIEAVTCPGCLKAAKKIKGKNNSHKLVLDKGE